MPLISIILRKSYAGAHYGMLDKGIGADLVAAAQKWLQARGIGSLRVRCNAVRDRAHRFYERLGFRLTKSQKVFDIAVDAPLKRLKSV